MTLKEIMHWITENVDDVEAMDKINKMTFPFTTKYSNFVGERKYEEKYEEEDEDNDGLLQRMGESDEEFSQRIIDTREENKIPRR